MIMRVFVELLQVNFRSCITRWSAYVCC